nr:hypothetical protein [Elizabethkingia miricola]
MKPLLLEISAKKNPVIRIKRGTATLKRPLTKVKDKYGLIS